MSSVSKQIRRLRTARGLTQEELAQKLYVTRQTVSSWETGRSQPDLDALEQLAAALDTEVTEVIYGTSPSPNLRKLKRRWALIGGFLVTILAVLMIILLKNGAYGTWKDGIRYQFFNINYSIAYETIPESFSVELNLKDPESNHGKVLYEDESGCQILVELLQYSPSQSYQVWFNSYGVYDRTGSELVSGSHSIALGKDRHTTEMTADMTITVDGRTYPCHRSGWSGLLWKNGNQFAFYLDQWQELSLEDKDTVTVTVSGLTRLTTTQYRYWDIY